MHLHQKALTLLEQGLGENVYLRCLFYAGLFGNGRGSAFGRLVGGVGQPCLIATKEGNLTANDKVLTFAPNSLICETVLRASSIEFTGPIKQPLSQGKKPLLRSSPFFCETYNVERLEVLNIKTSPFHKVLQLNYTI